MNDMKIDKDDKSYQTARRIVAKIGRFGLGVAITGVTLGGVNVGIGALPFDLGKFKLVRGLAYTGASIGSVIIEREVGPTVEEKTGEFVDDVADAYNRAMDKVDQYISK